MDRALDAGITAFLERNRERIFADVDRMLRIDSVTGEPAEGAPLGRAINEALDAMLGICAAHGLKTRNIDGLVGEAVWGEGEPSVGILAHVDIVPAGSGWSKPPFELTVEDGVMTGRGVTDDKGPAVAALWALLAALNAGAVLNKKVVLIFGGDEESGMRCLRRYLNTEKAPDVAFSPDACFPVIHCEKTLCHGELAAPLPEGSALLDIRGGTRVNVVPDEAAATLSRVEEDRKLPEGVKLTRTGDTWTLTARGVSAHASTPEKGDNAIVRLLGALLEALPSGDPAREPVAGLLRCCKASDGSGFGIACHDDVSGALTLNLGIIGRTGDGIAARFDIRHPSSLDPEENLTHRLPAAAEKACLRASGISVNRGFCLGRDHFLVKKLMDVYNEVNGSEDSAIAIGGGTYARVLPCAVAYGMLFEGDPETAHMADERVSVASFMKATRIYANAIAELAK